MYLNCILKCLTIELTNASLYKTQFQLEHIKNKVGNLGILSLWQICIHVCHHFGLYSHTFIQSNSYSFLYSVGM